jgi:hypothetical protein
VLTFVQLLAVVLPAPPLCSAKLVQANELLPEPQQFAYWVRLVIEEQEVALCALAISGAEAVMRVRTMRKLEISRFIL